MITKNQFSVLLFILLSFVGNTQINCLLKDSINFTGKNFQKYQGKDIHDNLFFLQEETLIKTNLTNTWEYANLEL